MVDTSMIDVYAFYERYVTLVDKSSRVWRTGDVEYHSNCPWCGGFNRFAFWSSGRYSCSIRASGCGRYGRDVIDFLREYEGLSFREACEELGVDPGRAYTRPTHHWIAAVEAHPPKLWQERAAAVIHQAQRFLWSPRGQGALDYLRQRGFTDDTICRAVLGYIPFVGDGRWYQDAPEHWGLSKGDDSHNGVWLPEGILIPWYAGQHIWKLHIRRLSGLKDGDAKYVQVKGSREGLYNVDTIRVNTPLVVCEGEFDALAGQQRCSDVASWVATGATTRARRDRWLARMAMASSVLVAYDDDIPDRSGKCAGEEGALYWERTLPHAMRWPLWMHDVNEMVQQGHDLRTWIELGLAVAAIALAPTVGGGYRVQQRGKDPGEVGSDDQQTISYASNMLKKNVLVTYERLQGVNRVQTAFGPGVIYPYTPLLIQVQRGRVSVLLDKPVHESGRRLEYFFADEMSSAHASL